MERSKFETKKLKTNNLKNRNKMKANTNKSQFKYLIDWMCEHPDIGRGLPETILTHQQNRQLVESLFLGLNRLGPPHKTYYMWRKVWADYRRHTKNKFREHFSNQRFRKFSELEIRVIELLQLKEQFNITDEEFTAHLHNQRYHKFNELEIRVIKLLQLNGDEEINTQSQTKPSKRAANKRKILPNVLETDDDEDENSNAAEDTSCTTSSNLSKSDNNSSKEVKNISGPTDLSRVFEYTELPSPSVATESEHTTEEKKIMLADTRTVDTEAKPKHNSTTQTPNPTKTKKNNNVNNNNLQTAILTVLRQIEGHMQHLNKTKERNADLLEENNKLLKLLIYRSTMKDKSDE